MARRKDYQQLCKGVQRLAAASVVRIMKHFSKKSSLISSHFEAVLRYFFSSEKMKTKKNRWHSGRHFYQPEKIVLMPWVKCNDAGKNEKRFYDGPDLKQILCEAAVTVSGAFIFFQIPYIFRIFATVSENH